MVNVICVRYFRLHRDELYHITCRQRCRGAPSHTLTYVKSVVDGVMFCGHDLTGLWGGTGKASLRINALRIPFHSFCIRERL